MSLKSEFRKMIERLDAAFEIPCISDVFLPPLHGSSQSADEHFMAIFLVGGAAGISFVLLPADGVDAYEALAPQAFVGRSPQEFALAFGRDDPVAQMLGMASINAICQHVMKATGSWPDSVTDPFGLLSIGEGDRIGMVGLFGGLVPRIQEAGADLVIIEKDESLVAEHPSLPITLDAGQLATCNKVLCTSFTVVNNTLDDVLSHCSPEALVSVIGPTAGYFPEPLFASGVDVVGGRVVVDSEGFRQRLLRRERWSDTTQKTCFEKADYHSLLD